MSGGGGGGGEVERYEWAQRDISHVMSGAYLIVNKMKGGKTSGGRQRRGRVINEVDLG
jgi:hypothetical protein